MAVNIVTGRTGTEPVSYTHLDVYKRQVQLITEKDNQQKGCLKNGRNNLRIKEIMQQRYVPYV